MPDLWVYRRRPNSLARHRHGGFNAAFQMNGHTIIGQMALDEGVWCVEEAKTAEPPSKGRNNVINFTERRGRGRAAQAPSLRGDRWSGDHTPSQD